MGKWEMVRLGDVGKVITGNTPPKKNKEYYDSFDIPFFKPNDFKNDEVTTLSITTEFISEQARNKARILPPNSILVTCIGTIGKVGITVHECSFNQQINAIIPNNNCISVYLGYAIFHKRQYLESIANAPVVPIINKTNFSDVKIPLPPLEIQQKIAATLDTAAALLKLRQQQLAELDALIQSVFYQMFGDPVRNEKGWQIKPINEFSTVRIGPFGSLLHVSDYIENGFPLVNPAHINNGNIEPDLKLTLTDDKFAELEKYIMKKNDIVVGRRGEIGRCAVVEKEGYLCGTGSMFIRVKQDYLPVVLQRILSSKSIRKKLLNQSVGVTMKNLNSSTISNLEVPMIPLSLQTQFAAIVQKIDQQKALVQQSIDETQTLFDSLMSQYFD